MNGGAGPRGRRCCRGHGRGRPVLSLGQSMATAAAVAAGAAAIARPRGAEGGGLRWDSQPAR